MYDFAEKFIIYLSTVRGLHSSTVFHTLKKLHLLVHTTVREREDVYPALPGRMGSSPFRSVCRKAFPSKRYRRYSIIKHITTTQIYTKIPNDKIR